MRYFHSHCIAKEAETQGKGLSMTAQNLNPDSLASGPVLSSDNCKSSRLVRTLVQVSET